nr:MAG: replication initiator protein [Microvirus sp.]
MPCYHPISAWQLLNVKTANGKPTISFKNPFGRPSPDRVGIQVPCGQCIGCRLERSRQWAIRCVHESKCHEENAFITLTYRQENLPKDGSLHKDHFQNFMKRLRRQLDKGFIYEKDGKEVQFEGGCKIKFFHCGEYGEKGARPHYHACIFGFSFPDKKLYSERDGSKLYRSDLLESLWPFGFSTIGNVTFESAAYVARYITKKITGEKAADHYKGKLPEYTTMSRGGNVKGARGIGAAWFKDYKSDVFPADHVVLRGKVMKPPRAYDKYLEADNPAEYEKIKLDRKAKALENAADNTAARLKTKETCKIAQFQQLKRGLEDET